ncbi:MAG: hypothetical protein Q8R98_09440 [Rubrivivax sp.]|nr:hypothetical protein [Rubrivivax sp.]
MNALGSWMNGWRGSRRRVLRAVSWAWTATVGLTGASAAPAPWAARTLVVAEPMRLVHAGGPTGLLGIGVGGSLWALSVAGQAPRRLASELDPESRIATGHGRIAARTARGGLWVWEDERAITLASAGLALHAGLLVLPLAVVAVVNEGAGNAVTARHRVARFEPEQGATWREVARSQEAVLPDARPIQVDLDGRGDGGHIAVLAGPDDRRYAHAVLGDGIEATRVLWLERHGLQTLRSLTLPAPHVFEDIEPRPVQVHAQMPQARVAAGLLTVRSGPEGGQLALVTADLTQPQGLRLAALGDTVGGFHRWLAPTTQGRHLVAVHTPHIGGVLHVYRLEGQRLSRRRLMADVSTHAIGSRETDLAAWVEDRLVLPSQDGRLLRVLDPAADWAELFTVALPGRATMTAALADGSGVAVLLADGRVVRVGA